MSGARSEEEEIARLRSIAERVRGDKWMVESDDAGTYLISYRANGDTAIIATFHDAIARHERELISSGLPILLHFLDMFGRARARVRELLAEIKSLTERKADYTTQAAMLLSNPTFWRFLETRGEGGPVADKDAADARMKKLLGVGSKKRFNDNEEARQAWRAFYADFDHWQKTGGQ